jgi:hypothetical protein
MFVPGKSERPKLKFKGKAQERGPFRSAIPNIRLRWPDLPGTNTSAYYENL